MTGLEQISHITNRALKSSPPFLPGTLCICIRRFAIHLSYKQLLVAKVFTEGHRMASRKKRLTPITCFSPPAKAGCSGPWLPFHVPSCLSTSPAQPQCRDRVGRRGDEASQSYQSSSSIKVAWIKSKTFCFAWNQERKRDWTLTPWVCFFSLLREPEMSTHQ